MPLPTRAVQLGLSFAATLPELFAGKDMGEDALRVLGDYLTRYHAIRSDVAAERPVVIAANRWSRQLR